MARRTRICPAGIPQHVVQRGYNRQTCFHDVADHATFYMYLARFSEQFGLDIHAWVLMNNHVHLLLTPRSENALAPFMEAVSEHYARYFSRKYAHKDQLWEPRHHACLVETEPYFLYCQRYIEMNPVMANRVSHPDSFQWSSYGNHARGMKTKFHTPHDCYLALAEAPALRQLRYQEFVAGLEPKGMAEQVRESVMSGRVLGSAAFQERMRKKGA